VDAESAAGTAYGSLSRALRRRRAELAELVESGATLASAARTYATLHPLEPLVTESEVTAAVEGSRSRKIRAAARKLDGPMPRSRKPDE